MQSKRPQEAVSGPRNCGASNCRFAQAKAEQKSEKDTGMLFRLDRMFKY